MRAILLAAGKGTRISRYYKCPKSTLEVNGVSIIEHSVGILEDEGISVTAVLGYGSEAVRGCLAGHNTDFVMNPFYSVTNSLGSLWMAKDYIREGEDLLVCNADVFWEKPVLDRIISSADGPVMAADSTRCDIGDYFFRVSDGYIKEYGKELPRERRTHEYVGMAEIPGNCTGRFRERLERMTWNEEYGEWWENVLYAHLDEEPVKIADLPDLFWGEVDYLEDYRRITEYARTGDVSSKLDRKFNKPE